MLYEEWYIVIYEKEKAPLKRGKIFVSKLTDNFS